MFRMTPTILKNFISPRATRRYPREPRAPFANARGRIVNDILTCTFCGVCAARCPSQCIAVDKKCAEWHYDPYACVYCGMCAESCPSGSLQQKREYSPPVPKKETFLLKGVIRKKKGG